MHLMLLQTITGIYIYIYIYIYKTETTGIIYISISYDGIVPIRVDAKDGVRINTKIYT